MSQSMNQALLLFVPLLLGSGLLWCIFRLRTSRAAAAGSMESGYAGDGWGVGPVVGIIIFAPVTTERCYLRCGRCGLLF
ncbi:hypothetical protein CORC01_11320 [Colletotrichum orchidophilum]|uniref:Uncharacterized protein n=1 Tax=Colletotrichum orchidophilum TaxID=1209926 RepID=A0A1G4AW33_9PEZI|nr:uncharacterized protein CORC01_11320 [Colletotrichum orchidophilum]OHE93370.1 hypothetical protein CORC01_11320 [Colletotrichum orchidophilum]